MNTMLINIGFNLLGPVYDLILKTSQEIRDRYNSDWYIDDKKYHLHFPMYLISIPSSNEALISGAAEEYLKYCKRVEVEIIDMFFNSNGLLMLKFLLTKEILDLHTLSLKYFNPLRENLLRDKYLDEKYLSKLSSEVRTNVLEYGSEYVLDNYVPHVTIARIKDVRQQNEILSNYRDLVVGTKGRFDKLQVHTAIFSENKEDDRTILLFDRSIN
ncbi:hypothetical protein HYV12_00575 [Candidatus Dojkabacteria bacterium]|nr:hypothetical protein [Candidatus Dojkabacteria bacterium]